MVATLDRHDHRAQPTVDVVGHQPVGYTENHRPCRCVKPRELSSDRFDRKEWSPWLRRRSQLDREMVRLILIGIRRLPVLWRHVVSAQMLARAQILVRVLMIISVCMFMGVPVFMPVIMGVCRGIMMLVVRAQSSPRSICQRMRSNIDPEGKQAEPDDHGFDGRRSHLSGV